MPADWAFAIIYVMVFGFAVYIGFLLGDGWGKRIVTTRAYWLCNAAMLVGAVLLVSLVMVPFIQVSAMGVPTLDGLGARGDGAHAVNEHILIDQYVPRIALLASLILKI